MAIKKNAKEKVVNINEVVKLFSVYDKEAKEAKKKADEQKEIILEYAAKNRDKFEANRLSFENGVYVEGRKAIKVKHSDIEDWDWVEQVVQTEYADILEISLEKVATQNAMLSGDKNIQTLLKKVNVSIETTETLAVYAKGK